MNKCTPLHCAAMNGHTLVAERLYTANPRLLHIKDKGGKTPAWWAQRRGHVTLAQRLKALEQESKTILTTSKSSQVAPEP